MLRTKTLLITYITTYKFMIYKNYGKISKVFRKLLHWCSIRRKFMEFIHLNKTLCFYSKNGANKFQSYKTFMFNLNDIFF